MRHTNQAEERHRQEIEGWQAGLDALHRRVAHRFRRAEVRERAKRYMVGLLRYGSWGEAHPGGSCPSDSGSGRRCTAATANGATKAFGSTLSRS